jgi:2,4-dienoyl-CoA reductase-like NADH-dependent reductase (Old Yellow Enzyme family)
VTTIDTSGILSPTSDAEPSTPLLFQPITIRGLTVRNRIWVAPMCQYSVSKLDGVPTDWHLVHLGAMATGGAGIVIVEASAVSPEGRITDHDTGMWNTKQREAWAHIVEFLHAQGAAAGIQLAHAGRKASTYPAWGTDHTGTVPANDGGWPTVSASAIPFGTYAAPAALDAAGIDGVVADFVQGAIRSVEAGFDLLEIHAAHGYLLHQFLSPLSNTREDEYGGSLENRARLLVRIVREIRTAVGEAVPLMVRFSATDWSEGGWDQEQTATVTEWVAAAGADFADVSSGGNISGASRCPPVTRCRLPVLFAKRREPPRAPWASSPPPPRPKRSCSPETPTSFCSAVSCCATRTSRCAPPTNSVWRSTTGPASMSARSGATSATRLALSGDGSRPAPLPRVPR